MQVGERERIQAAEEALARRRRVVAKLEAQANCQAQQQRAFARVSQPPLLTVAPQHLTALRCAVPARIFLQRSIQSKCYQARCCWHVHHWS